MTVAGIVLAAGEGRRFGGPKQLARVGGLPMLERVITALAAVPALDPIVVVLGAHATEVRAGVDFGVAEPVECADWADGQSASLRAGLDAVGNVDAVVVALGDQPGVTPQVVAMVLDSVDNRKPAARACYAGVPGHPVLIKRSLFAQVRELRGDTGAREVLERVDVQKLEAAHLCSGIDVDTPADLEALSA
jgi:CTP:molybdopterin cytidylyltransferase MocA